jgi:hypothetical protein
MPNRTLLRNIGMLSTLRVTSVALKGCSTEIREGRQ